MRGLFLKLLRVFSSGSSTSDPDLVPKAEPDSPESAADPEAVGDLGPIGAQESLSRGVFLKDHVNYTKRTVGWRAFLEKRPELSVLRVDGLSDAEIWAYGDKYVAVPSNRVLYARGDFTASDLTPLELTAAPDPPPRRHANVLGWPDDLEPKKLVAQKLRQVARPVVR